MMRRGLSAAIGAAMVMTVSASVFADSSMSAGGLSNVKRATLRIQQHLEASEPGAIVYFQRGELKTAVTLNRSAAFCRIIVGKHLDHGVEAGTTVKLRLADEVPGADGILGLNAVGFVPEGKGPQAIREIACFATDNDPIGFLGIEENAPNEQLGAFGVFAEGTAPRAHKVADLRDAKSVDSVHRNTQDPHRKASSGQSSAQ